MTLGAALGNSGTAGAAEFSKGSALEYNTAIHRQVATPSQNERMVRIVIDGIEYNARLIGPVESIIPTPITY